MKKVVLSVVFAIFIGFGAFCQGVSDNAVIPVSVTLNSILRLNVESGGNIEFVFNTLDQYKNGINKLGGKVQYQTKLTVVASQSWNLYIGADDANLKSDESASVFALDNIGLSVTDAGTNKFSAEYAASTYNSSVKPLLQYSAAPANLIVGAGTGNSGDNAANILVIDWRCGTAEGTMSGTSLLNQKYKPGRYSTNVLLTLELF